MITRVYELLRNRVVMQDINNLINTSRSWYYLVAAVITAGGIAIVALRARSRAQYYNLSGDQYTLPEGIKIVRVDAAGLLDGNKSNMRAERRRKLVNTAVTALLIVFIFAALALNILIILIGTATPGNEVNMGNDPLCVQIGYDAAFHHDQRSGLFP